MSDTSKAVFLSYASQDAAAAHSVCESLRAAGIEVWFDQSELRGGDAWDQRIRHQIRACALFVPIISVNTASRPEGYFRLEWDLADQRSHRVARNRTFIVPVCIDGTPDSGGDVPESFLKVQWTRLPDGVAPAAFCTHVASLLAPPAAAPAGSVQVATAPATAPPAGVPPAAAARNTRRWLPAAIAAAVLVAAAMGWQAWRIREPQAAAGANSGAPASAASGTAIGAAAAAPEKSIAVLPFVDMSEKHDQEYFSDGLSEELIDHLAHNPGLKVIARTSSFAFKGKNEDMRTIAAALGVAHLLEGSVRKAGTAMRITAQLIRASDGVHLWSQTYDRRLTDVFKVQDEIAATVAGALNATLQSGAGASAGAAAPGARAVDPEAHNLYLQGRFFAGRATVADVHAAMDYYRQALRRVPDYAAAWAALAAAYAWDAQFGNSPVAESSARARAAAREALKFDPRLPEGHNVLALIASSYDFDWPVARSESQLALSADPHNPATLEFAALFAFSFGERDRATELLQEAFAVDPLRASGRMFLGSIFYNLGRYDDALGMLRAAERINPQQVKVHYLLGLTLLAQGHPESAGAAFEAESAQWYRLTGRAIFADAQGRRADADAALAELRGQYADTAAAQIAEVYSHRHDVDAAMTWLERAYRERDPGIRWISANTVYAPLHGDPRFKALVARLKLPQPQS
jgi:TolB-like protein/tetratricopeptide (TPR) repeat protein